MTVGFCLLAIGCGKDHDNGDDTPPLPFERTVLVYMSAENNLSGENIIKKEMEELRVGSRNIGHNALVVYVDDSSPKPPYIIRLQDGVTKDSLSFGKDTLSSSPQTIKYVLDYTSDHYPALEYGLVLWGHASGWVMEDSVGLSRSQYRAFGMDNGRNSTSPYLSGKWINIPTLSKVLSDWDHKLRFILGDCCLFQCIECAYELRHTADFIIGSAAEIPGKGAPYDTMTKSMFNTTDTFYQAIADSYFAQVIPISYTDSDWRYHEYNSRTPLSVVKTSELPQLAVATNAVLHSFLSKESNMIPSVAGLIYYGKAQKIDMYDMNDIMLHNADSTAYSKWKEAFDRAVVYKKNAKNGWMTNGMVPYDNFKNLTDERYGGISMFVPQTIPYQTPYQEYITHLSWYYAAGLYELGW